MNRFQLIEDMKTAFGAKGVILGAWTKKDGTIITDIANDDVTPADLDDSSQPNVGLAGAMYAKDVVGLPGQEVRMFLVAYLEKLDTGAAIKKSGVFYVTDFGDAVKEDARWQQTAPAPKAIAPNTAIRLSLIAFLDGLIGDTPTGMTGTVSDYALEGGGQSLKAFEVTLHMADASNVSRKVDTIVRLTDGTAPNFTFELDKVG